MTQVSQAWKELVDSLWKRNALFVVVLGNCSALIVSTTMEGSISYGLALAFCLFFTSAILSAMRNIIPNSVRIPVEVCTGATFVTIVDLFMHAKFHPLWLLLGIYLPLITVN